MKTMNDVILEYAEALFAVACEENSKDEYAQALESVKNDFEENPEYMEFLLCPGIPMSERLSAIEEAFTGKLPEYIVYFLQLLCEKGRIQWLSDCVKEYNALVDASENVAEAVVTTAVELTQSEKERLKTKLEKMLGRSVEIECVTDPSVMGGVLIETEGRVIDGSLRRRLNEVKDVIGR